MADVLINFIGSGDGLAPANDALDNLIKKEGTVGETWKTTTATMGASNKTNTEGTNKLAAAIDNLSVASKSMDKAVIGGAYKQYLTQIQAQLGLTNKELIAYIQNARKAAQEAIVTAESDEKAKEFGLSVEVMNEALAKLGVTADGTSDKTNLLATRLRQAKEAFAQLNAEGITSGPVFEAAKEKLTELSKQSKEVNETARNLGSDHKNLDAFIDVVKGAAAGYEIFAGAQALFGEESEEVHKALLKLNAAMAILQGLTEIQNLLTKESSLNLLLNNLFRKQQVVATTEATVATTVNTEAEAVNVVATEAGAVAAETLATSQGAQVVATEAATVATEALNAAMLLNPAGIVIAAVLALVGAYALLSGPSKEERQNLLNINDAITDGTIHIKNYLAAIEHSTDRQVADGKLVGKSVVELAAIQGKAGNDRLHAIDEARKRASDAYNAAKADDKESTEAKAKLYDTFDALDKQYEDEHRALVLKGVEFRKLVADEELKSFVAFQQAKVLATIAGSDAERTQQIAATKAIAAEREKSADFIALTDGEKAQARAEDDRKIIGLQLGNYQHYLKDRTAATEASVADLERLQLKTEVDSIASIERISKAEIDAINKKRKEALSDPTLNANERRKINAEANLAIANEQKQLEIDILKIKQAAVNAALVMAIKGTEDEYAKKIESIEIAQKIELEATKLTQEQIDLINNRAAQAKLDALRELLTQQLQDAISYDNAQLDQFGISEGKKLDITLKRLDEQRRIELLNAGTNAAQIAAIEAKYIKQSVEAKLAAIEAVKAQQIAAYEAEAHAEKQANERTLANSNATGKEKIAAIENLRQYEQQKKDLDEKALNDEHDAAVKAAGNNADALEAVGKEYNTKYKELANERNDIDQSASDKTKQITSEMFSAEVDKAQTLLGLFSKTIESLFPDSSAAGIIGKIGDFGAAIAKVAQQWDDLTSDEKKEALKKLAEEGVVAAEQIINDAFAKATEKRHQELDKQITDLETQKDRELAVKNITEQQKADVTQRYADKEKQLKRQAFEADKRAKRSQAEINAALGATLAFAEYPWPYSLVVAGITAGLAAIEINAINSSNPGFKGGVIDLKGPGTATSDSIQARLSKGESVMTAKETTEWKGALLAMRENRFPDWVNNYRAIVYPTSTHEINNIGGHPEPLDYEALGSVVGKHIAANLPSAVNLHNTIDEHGLRSFMEKDGHRTEFLNKRYTMRG